MGPALRWKTPHQPTIEPESEKEYQMKAAFASITLCLAGTVSAQQQTTCQRLYNQFNCTTTGAPAASADTNAPWRAFAQQQAAQQAATAQMISAQAAARAQVEAARIQAQAQVDAARIQAQGAPPAAPVPPTPPAATTEAPHVPLDSMSPDARRSAIGSAAASATTENLQSALPKLQHLCETTETDLWCDSAKITQKELAWRAAQKANDPLESARQKALLDRIEAREKPPR
jgi:hypothetical protein